MAEKMSTLVMKVDLECSKCYNKMRRTLCSYHHEIRSQVIDKKAQTITITGPFDAQEFSNILKKKAGKAIKGIDIKKKEEEKPKEKPADAKPAEKPKEKAADAKPAAEKPKEVKPAEKPKEAEKPKKVTIVEPAKADAPKPAAPTPAHKAAEPAPGMKLVEPGPFLAYPMLQPYGAYTVPCYEGYVSGGPVYDAYGRPIPYDGYGGNRGYYGHNNNGYNHNNNCSSDYFSETNPSCNIM